MELAQESCGIPAKGSGITGVPLKAVAARTITNRVHQLVGTDCWSAVWSVSSSSHPHASSRCQVFHARLWLLRANGAMTVLDL